MALSNIVEELRINKRQLAETGRRNWKMTDRRYYGLASSGPASSAPPRENSDISRRHEEGFNVPGADNNNNNNGGGNYYNASSSSSSWKPGLPALTPTSAAAAPRSGQSSRSKRRRSAASRAAGELSYDEHGALDLTTAAACTPLNSAASRRASASVMLSAATINLVTDDSSPLDLSVGTRLPYVGLFYLSTGWRIKK